MKLPFRLTLLAVVFAFVFQSGIVQANAQTSSTTQTATSAPKKAATPAPSAQDIADAKSKGMVWVNTSTHVYHPSSSSLYGTTKHGKFMTEDDAKKAGYRAAKQSSGSKKQTTATATSK